MDDDNKPSEPQQTQKSAARAFAIEAARLAANTRCHQVAVLDVSEVSPVTDFFVLATGTSARQMRTVADEVTELGAAQGARPLSVSGYEAQAWILVDFVDVVCHVFTEEARSFYDLDGLWGDAPRVQWNSEPAAAPAE